MVYNEKLSDYWFCPLPPSSGYRSTPRQAVTAVFNGVQIFFIFVTGGSAATQLHQAAIFLFALPGFCIRLADARIQKAGSTEPAK